jgi:glycosyltransferase involved in cell wall biosynthesis
MRDSFLSIADLFPPERFGGSERVILELTLALAKAGYAAGVLAGGRYHRMPDPAAAFPVWRYPVRISPLPSLLLTSYRRLRAIPRLPVIGDGGALLLHHPISAWGALRAGHGRRTTPIGFYYGPIDEEWSWHWRDVRRLGARGVVSPLLLAVMPSLLAWIQRSVLRRVRGIVVLGSYTQRLVEEAVPDGTPVRIIPPGVDLDRFHPAQSKSEAKRVVGLDPNSPVILSVRRLVPRMGLSTLLEAVWILRRSRPSVRLVLVGTGEMAPRLMREAAAMGIADCLSLTGHVKDLELADFYRAADVFVLPSIALEGFGLVTLEALASGVPVVGTTIGQTPSVIGTHAELGRLVAPGDARAMAGACDEVLEAGPQDQACRSFACGFSWAGMADSVRDFAASISQ